MQAPCVPNSRPVKACSFSLVRPAPCAPPFRSRSHMVRNCELVDFVFREIVAGPCWLPRGVGRAGFRAECWGMILNENVDLVDDASFCRMWQQLVEWTRQRKLCCVHLAFPCTTWPLARHPAPRSRTHLWGLPSLFPDARSRWAMPTCSRVVVLSCCRFVGGSMWLVQLRAHLVHDSWLPRLVGGPYLQ